MKPTFILIAGVLAVLVISGCFTPEEYNLENNTSPSFITEIIPSCTHSHCCVDADCANNETCFELTHDCISVDCPAVNLSVVQPQSSCSGKFVFGDFPISYDLNEIGKKATEKCYVFSYHESEYGQYRIPTYRIKQKINTELYTIEIQAFHDVFSDRVNRYLLLQDGRCDIENSYLIEQFKNILIDLEVDPNLLNGVSLHVNGKAEKFM